METNALTFANLQTALDSFINDFIVTYRGLLIRDDKKASGNLIKSLKPVSIVFDGTRFSGSISLASYWKYVEYGRKPGKFPPVNKILEWLKPTKKQLAFLISRKIARDGIEPGKQFKEALDLVWAKDWKMISDALEADLNEAITLITI